MVEQSYSLIQMMSADDSSISSGSDHDDHDHIHDKGIQGVRAANIRKKSFSDSCIAKEPNDQITAATSSARFLQKWFPSSTKKSVVESSSFRSVRCSQSDEGLSKSTKFSPWKLFSGATLQLHGETLNYNRLSNSAIYDVLESRNYSSLINKEDVRFVQIYTDNYACYRVPVNKLDTAFDVCRYVVKNNLLCKSFDACWSIVEHWGDFGIERVLEDHESVFKAFRKLESLKLDDSRLFIRRMLRKYCMFEHEDLRSEHVKTKKRKVSKHRRPTLESYGRRSDYFKIVRLPVKIILKENGNLCLRDVDLDNDSKHFIDDNDVLLSKYKTTDPMLEEYARFDSLQSSKKSLKKNKEININDVDVYTTINAQTQFKAQSQWGICLLRKTKLGRNNVASRLFVITFATEDLRNIWLNAFRMVKYGDQLKKNYEQYLTFKDVTGNPEPQTDFYPKNNTCNSDYAIYVFMDFSGPEGRIVDDPEEIKRLRNPLGPLSLDFNEEQNPHSRNKRFLIQQPKMCTLSFCALSALEEEPWFHGKIDRKMANSLINNCDDKCLGTFLLRLSLTNNDQLILSFYTEEEIYHVSIIIYVDKTDGKHVYSINHGLTTFLEISHLVKFYQTDNDYLPITLTNYVQKR